jgi:hypothetical protein
MAAERSDSSSQRCRLGNGLPETVLGESSATLPLPGYGRVDRDSGGNASAGRIGRVFGLLWDAGLFSD